MSSYSVVQASEAYPHREGGLLPAAAAEEGRDRLRGLLPQLFALHQGGCRCGTGAEN